jgi:uncharacterized membrane protein
MGTIVKQGRLLFGAAIIGFGIENLMCAHFRLEVRGVPWFPAEARAAYLTGVILLAAGLSIVSNARVRLSASLLGILFVYHVLVLEGPLVIAKPMNLVSRTVFFETLAICASALTLAGTSRTENAALRRSSGVLDHFIRSCPYLFGVSAVVFGIDHFLVLPFIASLVPAWISGGVFWAYFTGAAFIAAGISILTKKLDQWGAGLLGMMFFLWFVLLHAPRVASAYLAHDPSVQNEWSSAFIALAMCGGSWIIAWYARQRPLQAEHLD